MDRTADAALGNTRLAFWGYTNSCGATAALALARQLRACEAALDGRAEITRFFYETPEPINDLMILAVRGAGGPSQRDGGWDQLAAALPCVDRDFDAVICESLDRIGRTSTRVLGRERLVAKHGATILCANEPSPELSEFVAAPSDRLWRPPRASPAWLQRGNGSTSTVTTNGGDERYNSSPSWLARNDC
jgi:hypothetical protein